MSLKLSVSYERLRKTDLWVEGCRHPVVCGKCHVQSGQRYGALSSSECSPKPMIILRSLNSTHIRIRFSGDFRAFFLSDSLPPFSPLIKQPNDIHPSSFGVKQPWLSSRFQTSPFCLDTAQHRTKNVQAEVDRSLPSPRAESTCTAQPLPIAEGFIRGGSASWRVKQESDVFWMEAQVQPLECHIPEQSA